MAELDVKKACRVCLKTRKTLYSLYRKINGKSPYENLISRTKINIEPDDTGPSSICEQCLHDLDVTLKFLERCEESNKALSNVLSLQKHETKSNKIELKVKIEKPKDELSKNEIESIENVGKGKGKCTKCEGRIRCKHVRKPLHTCQYCQKVFTDRSNFNRHIKRHMGRRDWPCPTCGSLQVTGWLAWRHCRPPPRRPCLYPGCHKTFSTAGGLTVHVRGHTGEKPFECNDCGKRFVSKSVLHNHLNTHSDVKPYMCSVCGRQFATNKLRAHLLRAHGLRRPAPRGRPRELYTHYTTDMNDTVLQT